MGFYTMRSHLLTSTQNLSPKTIVCRRMTNKLANFSIFLAVAALSILSSSAAEACFLTDPIYKLRQDSQYGNRHEGITNATPISPSPPKLSSISSRGLRSIDDSLTIYVPRLDNYSPYVIVRAPQHRYLLNNFALNIEQNLGFYSFTWPTCILKKRGILVQDLQAIADVSVSSSEEIYVPVIIGEVGSRYEIAFHAGFPSRFRFLEIRQGDQVFFSTQTETFQSGEIKFTWNGKGPNNTFAPSGKYQIRYNVEVRDGSSLVDSFTLSSFFEHNSAWLRE